MCFFEKTFIIFKRSGDSMLSYNRIEDREEMLKYHRTKDMINLLMYFPDISPVRNLTIVKSILDYEENYDVCSKLPMERNDTLVTKPSIKSIETKGINVNIEDIFNKMKEIDSDSVLVLFSLCHEPSERYERYAGISVGVSLGTGVYIDAVGKGFDGREVSKGIAVHERYFIPWFDLRRCNINNFRDYRNYLINEIDYIETRNNRIEFLTSIGIDKDVALKSVPDKYQEIPDFIWSDIIKNIIKKLEKMEDELSAVGLNEFAISGNTEGKKYYPW